MRKTVHQPGGEKVSQDIFYFIEFSVLGELTLSWLQLSSREATVLTEHAREVEQTGPLGWPGAGAGWWCGPSHIDHTAARPYWQGR